METPDFSNSRAVKAYLIKTFEGHWDISYKAYMTKYSPTTQYERVKVLFDHWDEMNEEGQRLTLTIGLLDQIDLWTIPKREAFDLVMKYSYRKEIVEGMLRHFKRGSLSRRVLRYMKDSGNVIPEWTKAIRERWEKKEFDEHPVWEGDQYYGMMNKIDKLLRELGS